MKKRVKLIFIGALAAVTSVTAIRLIVDWGRNEPDYSAAEALIEQQRYDEALINLNVLENDHYKSADALRDFCLAHQVYAQGDVEKARVYMIWPSEYYDLSHLSHTQLEETRAFRKQLNDEIDDYRAQKEAQEEQEAKTRARTGVPYVGMSEDYIAITTLGSPDPEVRHNSECISGEQYTANLYTFTNNNKVVFEVRCVRGEVVRVWDFRDRGGGALPPQTSASPKPKGNISDDDPFHARDYYDAEDFYYDYYDDFYDYEDAEDYFNEHHG